MIISLYTGWRERVRAAKFNAELRRNRQLTLPKENLDAIAHHLQLSTNSLCGCVLELNISAIRINNVTYRIPPTGEKEKQKE